jgi:hypothetical protein
MLLIRVALAVLTTIATGSVVAPPAATSVGTQPSGLSVNPDTNYKREMAGYFEKVGRKVSWQELGNGFENHQFQFQVIDEGEYQDRDWRDELGKLLDATET